MKHTVAIAAALLLLILPESASASWRFMRGDTNGDQQVDLSDTIQVLQFLFSGAPSLCPDAMDANDDGVLDIADPLYIVYFLFLSGPALPPPGPGCWGDPTPDALDCEGPVAGCPDSVFWPDSPFSLISEYPVDGILRDAAVGELNGDGIPDFVVVHSGLPRLSVLLSDGPTNYEVLEQLGAPSGADWVSLADFDGDALLDALIVGSDRVRVLLGTVSGSFVSLGVDHFVGDQPDSHAVADFDGDGLLDVATGNRNSDSVSLLFGLGGGDFAPALEIPMSVDLVTISAGDFNGDGFPDLVTAAVDGAGTEVLLNDGLGGFGPPLPVGPFDAMLVKVGDFDSDGNLDVISANGLLAFVSVFLGNGDGTFAPFTNGITGEGVIRLVLGDLDRDGHLDVVAGRSTELTTLLGTGTGALTERTDYPIRGLPFGLADVDGDGTTDLLLSSVQVYWGSVDGTFLTPPELAGGPLPGESLATDVDRDGTVDLVSTSNWGVVTWRGGVDGLEDMALVTPLSAGLQRLAHGDLDGDGVVDLVGTSYGGDRLIVLLGVGDGTYTEHASYSIDTFPRGVTVADYDFDGVLDVALVKVGPSALTVLWGLGDGSLSPGLELPVPFEPWEVTSGDLNGDAIPDVVAAGDSDYRVYLSNGARGFEPPIDGIVGGCSSVCNVSTIRLGDIDGDGVLDLVATWRSDGVSVYLGHGDGTFGITIGVDWTLLDVEGSAETVRIADANGDSRLDLVVLDYQERNVAFYFGFGDGTFASPLYVPVALYSRRLAVGDFDGDADPDVATTNTDTGVISVHENRLIP